MTHTSFPRVCATAPSPLGPMMLAASDRGLCGLWFMEGQKYLPAFSDWTRAPEHPVLSEAARQVAQYFAGERGAFDLPLDLQCGTAFQQAVWLALLSIPVGGTTSYGAISRSIGKPQAMRAVGAAIGRNPLSIIVPCHRVIGADGSLTGYAGGMARKTALLRLESPVPAARPAAALF